MVTKSASKSKASNAKANAAAKPVQLRLYRVWRHTDGDENAHEIAVIASSDADARAKATAHVKSTNKGKGTRSQTLSQSLTTILSVKQVRDKHCLEISTVPLAAIKAIPKRTVTAAIASVAKKKTVRAAASAVTNKSSPAK